MPAEVEGRSEEMKCEEVKELLGAYRDGELEGEERARVAEELTRCESCQTAYRELDAMTAIVQRAVLGPPWVLRMEHIHTKKPATARRPKSAGGAAAAGSLRAARRRTRRPRRRWRWGRWRRLWR